MNITLSALSAAVVSACFITTGPVLDTAPVFPVVEIVDSITHVTLSVTQGQAMGVAEVETSLGMFSVYFKKDVEEKSNVETVTSTSVVGYSFEGIRKPEVEHTLISYGESNIVKHKQPKPTNILETVGMSDVFAKDNPLPNLSMSLTSQGHADAILRSYNLRYVSAYFKHTTSLSSYEVFGIYNNTIVFGSSVDIHATNLYDEVYSQGDLTWSFIRGIPHTTEEVITDFGNIQTYTKFEDVPNIIETVTTVLVARDPSNVSPYKILTLDPFNVTSEAIIEPYVQDIRPIGLNDVVESHAELSMKPYKLAVGSVDVITEATLLQYYKHEMINETIQTVSTVWGIETSYIEPVSVEHDISSSLGNLFPVAGENIQAENILNNTESQLGIVRFSRGAVVIDGITTAESNGDTASYVKDSEAEGMHGVASSGASDMRFGDVIQISRTESVSTLLGSIICINNPGFAAGVTNTISAIGDTLLIFGDNKETEDALHTVTTAATVSIIPYKLTENVSVSMLTDTASMLYHKSSQATDILHATMSAFDFATHIDRAVYPLVTLNTNAAYQWVVKDATAVANLNTATSTLFDTLYYMAPTYAEAAVVTTASQAFVQMYTVLPVEVAHTMVTELPNVQTRVKDMLPTVSTSALSNAFIQHYPEHVLKYIENYITSQATMNIMPYKIAQYFVDNTLSEFGMYPYVKDSTVEFEAVEAATALGNITILDGLMGAVTKIETVVTSGVLNNFEAGRTPVVLDTLTTQGFNNSIGGDNKLISTLIHAMTTTMATQLIKSLPVPVTVESLTSVNTTEVRVKDTTPTVINTAVSSGASDMQYGSDIQISRTESVSTLLGAMSYRNNPGLNVVTNTLVSGSTSLFVRGQDIVQDNLPVNTAASQGFTATIKNDQPTVMVTATTAGDANAHAEYHQITDLLNTVVSNGYTDMYVRDLDLGATSVTPTVVTALANVDIIHSNYYTITLNRNGGTGGTTSIATVADFYITPTSITIPTRAHYTFNGYYTATYGGTQRINSSGTYVALDDNTYLADATLYAQWTDVQYAIVWKSYAGTPLKTEDLIYGSTSLAPAGSTDTAQYDYSWPKASTTVTGSETITETRVIKSYLITWKSYSGAPLKSETLKYGATSTAPTGTSDTTQYDYAWPKSSTTVVGTETITETRTTKSYTITWYTYSGAVAKQETLLYGATSTAPTGTTDTMQYQYDWPKASTTVTGTESINETRTLLSYTVTWYKYGQSGETYAKRETRTYNSTSTAPTGTTDTAQYDYSWPKSSTTVVDTENITETRAIKSYTITWKYYTGDNALVETLNYGAISTAPLGTSDTTAYNYSWPKASTTVVGAETITETRVGQPYTVTFNGNGGSTPSPTSKGVIYNNTYGTLATVSRTNWEFLGWFTAASGGTKRTSSSTMLTTSNHTLYAHWNPTNTASETIINTMATSGASDVRSGNTVQFSRTESAISALGGMQYFNQTVFAITLNRNGGTGGTTSISGSTGINITPTSITIPTYTNYTFTGYYTATSGGTKYINDNGSYNNLNSNTFVGNVTLYAQWTMNNAYFDWNPLPNNVGLKGDIYINGSLDTANASDWYQSKPANATFKVAALTIPPGWAYSSYTTSNLVSVVVGGSSSTTEVQGTGNMASTSSRAIAITIVGISYSVTVAADGGTSTAASASTYTPKTSATSITMTRGTKINYRFSHWTVSGANGKATVSGNTVTIPAYTTSVQPYGNLTITAHWVTAVAYPLNTVTSSLGDMQYASVAPITITLDKRSGSGGTSSIISCSGFYLDPTSITPPTRAHHTFNGYYTATSGGTQRINSTGTYVALTNNTYNTATTLYAQWTLNSYTILWKNYAGTTLKTDTQTYGSTSTAPTGTTDTAQYDYSWPVSSTTITGNATITETRTTRSYTVTWYKYGQSGGTFAKQETLTYNSTSTAPTGTTDTAQYDYSWPKASTTVTGTENITETRAVINYVVYWRDYNGSLITSEVVAYGSAGTPPANPTRTGYTFSSWYGTYSSITGTTTIYAQYSINTYTVTFKDWDNTTLKTQIVNYESDATAPTNPTRTGHTFSSWSGTYTNVTSNRTITATYNINTYQVLFKDWNGTTLKTQTVNYGSNATAPSNPSRTGYTFTGWSDSYTNVTSDRTITATYTVNYYTITFKNYAGSVINTQSVEYSYPPSVPSGTADTAQYDYSWPSISTATADKTYQETRVLNYYTVTFKDWGGTILDILSVAFGATPVPPNGTPDTAQYDYSWPTISSVTGATTYQETRALQKYTVTFKDWNGTTLKTQYVNHGSNATAPSNPSRTCYTFTGWSGAYTNVTSDRTITATYSQLTYSVTYNLNGGSGIVPPSQTKFCGTNLTLRSYSGSKTGYDLIGWNTSQLGNGTNYAFGGTYTSNAATTLYAKWQLKTYAMTFNANGGTGTMATQYKTHGQYFSLPNSTFSRTGYTFVGWNDNAAGTGTTYQPTYWYQTNAAKTWYAKWAQSLSLSPDYYENEYSIPNSLPEYLEEITVSGSGTLYCEVDLSTGESMFEVYKNGTQMLGLYGGESDSGTFSVANGDKVKIYFAGEEGSYEFRIKNNADSSTLYLAYLNIVGIE